MDHQINIKENNLSSSVSPSSPYGKLHQIVVEDTPLIGETFEHSRQSVGADTINKNSELKELKVKKFKVHK